MLFRSKPIDIALPDLSSQIGPGWRLINSNVFGELDLRLILTQLTSSTRGVRGSAGWGGDRWALLERDGQQALVIKSVWDTENEARNFFDTFAVAMKNRFPTAKEEEASAARQALTASGYATDIRRNAATVVVVISFDRPTAEAIAAAVGS